MENILEVEISGKFNGRDARVSIGLEAESAFEIEDVNASEGAETSQAPVSEAETATKETKTEEKTSESPEGAGVEALFEEGEDEELPPLSASTLQYKPAKAIYDQDGGRYTSSEVLEMVEEMFPDDEWNSSKVTSHLYSLHDKGILDREKEDSTGKNEYFVTDVGEKVIEEAAENE